MLTINKGQSGTESGFKFIKNNAFEVDSIFLKTPARIDALMMVMTLCLMVYGVSQYELHQSADVLVPGLCAAIRLRLKTG